MQIQAYAVLKHGSLAHLHVYEDSSICSSLGGCPTLHVHLRRGRGHPEMVKYLATANADLNAAAQDVYTPLHSAAQNGHLDIMKYLVTAATAVNDAAQDGYTPPYFCRTKPPS